MVRVQICGGIASGKTTFAGLFRGEAAGVIFEDHESNPFWEKFYRDPRRYVFETEISFLIQHYSLFKEAVPGAGLFVADFSLMQALSYADVNLSAPRRRALEVLYRQILREVGEPDIIVHLVCRPEEELERVRRRGRDVESGMKLGYLDELNRAILARIAQVSKRVRVMTVDSEANDFAQVRRVQIEMVELILAEAVRCEGMGKYRTCPF